MTGRRHGQALGATIVCLLAIACAPRDGDPVSELPGATHRVSTAAGVRWHWVEAGSGEPLVLLHGMPGTWDSWRGVMPALAENFRVVALDLKAFGHSSAPEGDYSFCAVGAEVLALMDTLQLPTFRLAGHGWGAMIGACLASRAPERVVAYAHISAPLRQYDLSRLPDFRELVLAPQVAARFLRSPDVLVTRVYEAGATDLAALDPDIVPQRIEDLRGHADGIARYFRDMDLGPGWQMGPGMLPSWETMSMPVALLVGDRDLQVPLELFLDIDSLTAGPVRVEVVDDAGHFAVEEQPDRIATVLLEVLR